MIDVFKIGVHIGMTTNASQVLSLMLKELTGLHIAAGKLNGALDKIRTAAIGAGAVFVGWEVGKGLWNAIEANRELNKELEKTKQLGGVYAANLGQTRAAAFQTSYDAPTSIVSDNVRLSREIGATLGNPSAASEMLTAATKAAYVAHNFTGEDPEDIIKNLMRTADLRGQIYTMGADGKEHVDATKLSAELNAAVRGLELGGGFVTSAGMLQTARTGGAVVKEQTPEAFYAAGTEAGIAMGSSRLGTAETSLMAQFIGGTMAKKVAEHLTEAGMLHADEWKSGGSGGVVVDPKVAARFEPMMKDPVAWLSTGAGAEAVKAYAQKESISITAAIMQLFGRQTTQRLVNDAMSNAPQFARAREIYGNIPDVNSQYQELHDHDLDTNMLEVASAWKSFKEAFSDAGTPLLIPILHGLTNAIQLFTRMVANCPTITGVLTGLVGGIAALTVLGGGLVILNACWAPLAAGLGMLIGVPGLATLGSSITAAAAGLTGLASVTGLATLGATMAAVATGLGLLAVTAYGLPRALNWAAHQIVSPDEMHPGANIRGGLPGQHHGGASHPGGSGHGGGPVSPYVAPGATTGGTQPAGDVYLDKQKVGSIMFDHAADQLSRPSSGANVTDHRVAPWMPGSP